MKSATIYTLKHHKRDNTVTGEIKRFVPIEQAHRVWKCSGVINKQHLIVTFWSEEAIKSSGCIYTELIEDYTYGGVYLKSEDDQIKMIKIQLKKKKEDR